MKIHIYNNARSFVVCYWNDDAEWEDDCPYSTIDAAMEAAKNEIDVRQQAIGAHITDAETGEIYVTCTWDENDIPEEDYSAWDDDYWDDGCPVEDYDADIEMGFNPYLGAYDYDC